MRSLARALWVFAMGCFPLMGCNPLVERSLLVQVKTQVHPLCDPESCDTTTLEGVEVCEAGTSNCVLTDARGRARFAPPPDQEVSYTLQKEGYEAKLVADVSDWRSEVVWLMNLRDDERAAPWHDNLMSEYPMRGVGAVRVFLLREFEGATFELLDATGTAFYDVEADFPKTSDLHLEATTKRGSGGFLGLGPGEFEIKLGGTAAHCRPGTAWPGDEEDRVRFPIREGHLTVLWVDCPVPQ